MRYDEICTKQIYNAYSYSKTYCFKNTEIILHTKPI